MRRILQASAGLVVCALGTYMELCADLGVGPWESLNRGLTIHAPLSYGQVSVIVSVLILLTDLVLKEQIGIGTILDTVIMGIAVDFFLFLDPIHPKGSFLLRLLTLVAGIFVLFTGQYIYISAGLCCGPRDALLVAIGKRVRRIPIGAVTLVLFAAVFLVALLLGAPYGIGTLIATFGSGPIMQLVFGFFHFEPRDIVHTNLMQSIRGMGIR